MIATWWADLGLFMQIIWGVTFAATLIFIIQSVMTFIGADGGEVSDFDAAMDDPMAADAMDGGTNLYTFRNLINFALGFGWTVIILHGKIRSTLLILLIAIVVGAALVTAVMYLFKFLSAMQQSGNVNVQRDALGCTGSVYLPIPARREGEGKVQISIAGSVREFDAVTEGEELETGTLIKVIDVINPRTLLVEKEGEYTV